MPQSAPCEVVGGWLRGVSWGWIWGCQMVPFCSTGDLWAAVLQSTHQCKLAQGHPLLCKLLDVQARRGGYRFAARRDGGGVRGACTRHVCKRLHSCGGAELGQGPLVFTGSCWTRQLLGQRLIHSIHVSGHGSVADNSFLTLRFPRLLWWNEFLA